MSLEHNQLIKKADELREKLQAKRREVTLLEEEWKEANRKQRDWIPGESCQARSLVDGWRCCLNNDHEDQHETCGGYKFYQIR